MPLTRTLFAAVVAFWLSGPAAHAQDDKLSLDSVSIHLFLENSGEFSADITRAPAHGTPGRSPETSTTMSGSIPI